MRRFLCGDCVRHMSITSQRSTVYTDVAVCDKSSPLLCGHEPFRV